MRYALLLSWEQIKQSDASQLFQRVYTSLPVSLVQAVYPSLYRKNRFVSKSEN